MRHGLLGNRHQPASQSAGCSLSCRTYGQSLAGDRGGRAATTKTQREKDWIEALAVFFKDYDKVDLRTRTLAYEAAMARLAERYSDDTEAAIFYALALNEAVDLNDKTYAKQFKAAAILQAIEAKQPNHPGIPHYIIHSYDFAPICRQGLSAAQRYAELAPAVPHALHMPSHTFSMLGMWRKVDRREHEDNCGRQGLRGTA